MNYRTDRGGLTRLTAFFAALLLSAGAAHAGWMLTGRLAQSRSAHTATLLPNGKVLVAGGDDLGSAELYDPATGKWTPTGSLVSPHHRHTATLLPNGKVLLVGTSAELYDPSTGTWSPTPSLSSRHHGHTATLLPNGKVLVAGGFIGGSGASKSAVLYDPSTETWTTAGTLSVGRRDHTATLLQNGKVLLTGGTEGTGTTHPAPADVYDPVTGTWSTSGSLRFARDYHTATLLANGRVLVTGGLVYAADVQHRSTSCEIYDPETGTWTETAPLVDGRSFHTATLLPNGKVVVAGGVDPFPNDSTEIYDPATGQWSSAGSLALGRGDHTATLLPDGDVLIAGGGTTIAELYTPERMGSWKQTGFLTAVRINHTATLLPNGRVLVVGASDIPSRELYDPATGKWTATASVTVDGMPLPVRSTHTATLLPSGNVLIVGGFDSGANLASAEIYRTASDDWILAAPMAVARSGHTATLLPSGKVLVVGSNSDGLTTGAELYDPVSGKWAAAGSFESNGYLHTATLLQNGKVLVVAVDVTRLYDETTGTWTAAGSLGFRHQEHTATLLPNGKVLIASGSQAGPSAELYDPDTDTFMATAVPASTRLGSTATLLLNGDVLVTGGITGFNASFLASSEVYHPPSGSWTTVASLISPRFSHTATLLPDGKVLVAGGDRSDSAELYEADVPALPKPRLTTVSSPLAHGTPLTLTGTALGSGPEGGGGGTQNSPTNYPLFRIQALAGDRVAWLTPDPLANFADDPMTVVFSRLPAELDPGWHLLTPIRGGVIGESKLVQMACSLAIVRPPQSTTVAIGNRATFTVDAAGGRHYRWEKNIGTGWFPVGDDRPSYATDPVAGVDSGTRYRVTIAGACSSTTTAETVLTIFDDKKPAARIVSPNGGDYWVLSKSGDAPAAKIVTWSMSDDVRVCRVMVSLLYSNDGGTTYVAAPSGGGLPAVFGAGGSCAFPGETTTSVTYAVPATFPSGRSGSLYEIQLAVTDQAGNTNTVTSANPFYIVQANPDSVRTLILWNSARMASRQGIGTQQIAVLHGKLQELANHPRVQGLVTDLASVTAIQNLYSTWDAEPSNASKANAVLFDANGIHEYVRTNLLAAYSGVKYLVVVGDDRIIPMARMQDRTVLLLESTYPARGDLTPSGTTVGQALTADKYLTDDPLGVLDPITVGQLDGSLFLPDLAVGRLVETPQQIITTIATYISQDGILDLSLMDPINGHKVLVTGYDFLSNVATQQRAHWKRALQVSTPDSAPAPVDGSLIGDGWGLGSVQARASALRTKLSGNSGVRYGVMALTGHATHYEEGVPGTDPFDIQGLSTADIYGPDACGTTSAGALDLSGGIVYAIGCHGGLSVPGSCRTDTNHSLDLPETMLGRGVVAYIANSGYGWSLRFGIGYSARLSQIFTEQITSGGTIAVGDAVRQSKQRYYLETPRYDSYDEKSVMQWTLYGLPMYALKTGIAVGERTLSSAPAAGSAERMGVIRVRRQPQPTVNALPSSLTQLSLSFDFTANGVYEKHDSSGRQLPSARGCPDVNGCYYTLNGLVDRGTGSADLPIQPYVIYDSRLSGTSQHGVLWKGGTYDEESGWTPVIAQLISNGGDGSNHGPSPRKIILRPTAARVLPGVDSPVCRPTDLEVSSVTITGGEAVKEQLADPVYSIMRRYRTVDVEVFYFNNRTAPTDNCDRTGPSLGNGPFGGEYHQVRGPTLSWAVPATDSSGVWRVIVVYNTNAVDTRQRGTWTPMELTDDGTGTFRGTLRFDAGTRLTYVLQAVDNRGNVAWLDYVSAQLPSSGTALGVPKPIDVQPSTDPSPGRRRAVRH